VSTSIVRSVPGHDTPIAIDLRDHGAFDFVASFDTDDDRRIENGTRPKKSCARYFAASRRIAGSALIASFANASGPGRRAASTTSTMFAP